MPDPYQTLGVSRGATPQQIRSAYRALARRHHPDLSSAPDAAERFREICAAYAVLCDGRKEQESRPTRGPISDQVLELLARQMGGPGARMIRNGSSIVIEARGARYMINLQMA